MLVQIGLVRELRDGLDIERLARSKIVEMCRSTTVRVLLDEEGDVWAIWSADGRVGTECWEPSASGCVTCE